MAFGRNRGGGDDIALEQRALHRPVISAKHPVARLDVEPTIARIEQIRHPLDCGRPERRPKSLVRALMLVDQAMHLLVGRVLGLPSDPTVVAEDKV